MARNLPLIIEELNVIVGIVRQHLQQGRKARGSAIVVVAELYIKIFNLLANVMEWCTTNTWKRALKTARRDCYSEFADDLKKIREWSNYVFWDTVSEMACGQAALAEKMDMMRKELSTAAPRAVEFYAETKAEERKALVEGEQRVLAASDTQAIMHEWADMFIAKFHESFRSMGQDQYVMMNGMVGTVRDQQSATSGRPESRVPSQGDLRDEANLQSETAKPSGNEVRSRDEIQQHSSKLEDWYPDGHMILPVNPTDRPFLDDFIASKLTEWLKREGSHVLCLDLQHVAGDDPLSTYIAATVVSLALGAPFQTISYFCSIPPRAEVPEGRAPETIGLCELMASLVRQSVALLPDELPAQLPDFGAYRFELLDGTLRTWDAMLGLFDDLLLLAPPAMLIVLDGLQWLDGQYTTLRVQELLSVIRRHVDRPPTSALGGMKLLLTTAGHAREVVPCSKPGEHVAQEVAGRRCRVDFAVL
ncbi:hypothetical protein LTR36_009277 [Oleoguttula mirabilis]|uniref:Uncharacterized protein n=1 Tax=Oleoguttula mirabilis TaxID=1507867 RepID=A0AAV9J6L5_9PEZI|nr:hypothetical protein LTR36_009277 [Oleoguttula mirabilis]